MGSLFTVQVGSGGTPTMITDDPETLWLDILESEVVGGTCAAADRGSVKLKWIE